MAFSRLLLVGFMGSGKSTVGRAVALELGWRFLDFDDAIEEDFGASVAEIFHQVGEARFRELENRTAETFLNEDGVVLASGGGWAAWPGRVGAVPLGTATVWLSVSADEAVRRTLAQPGQRPLLEGRDPRGAARKLIQERAPFYAAAKWRVDTEGLTVEDVSARILRILAAEHTEIEPE